MPFFYTVMSKSCLCRMFYYCYSFLNAREYFSALMQKILEHFQPLLLVETLLVLMNFTSEF